MGASFRDVLAADERETFRLIKQLLWEPSSHFAARVSKWPVPLTREAHLIASLLSGLSGSKHPWLPDDPEISDAVVKMADAALEAMKGR